MSDYIVEIKKLTKTFYGVKAVDSMDFRVKKGEVKCLIGENGCGKSTLVKAISGFHPFDSGELYVNGKLYNKITPMEAMLEGIQVIYQDFAVFPNLTVAENIMMNCFISGRSFKMNWKKTREDAKKILDEVGVDIPLDQEVDELTVAEKQLVAICRALALDARLLIMDEPTTTLTQKEIKRLFKIIEDLTARGVAIVFISHKLDELKEIADSLTVMRDGKSVYDGSPDLNNKEIAFLMTGKELTESFFTFDAEATEELLRAEHLSSQNRFEDVSFSLHRGEILGVTGLLGSGRSELAQALFGVIPYDSGELYIHQKPVHIHSIKDAMDQKIAYVPEDRLTEGLHLDRSIGENATLCILPQVRNGVLLNNRKLQEKREELLHRIHIAGMEYDKAAKALSGGNQQKVVLLKWLATNPEIFILNCPTVGVDVGSKSEIHSLIRDVARTGVGVLVISDDISEIFQVCNRVVMMREGRLTDEYQIKDISQEFLERELIQD